MRITRISVYQVKLPLVEGSYNWSGGKSVSTFDSVIVSVDTDQGVTGWGECCPLGSVYLPAFATGAIAALAEIAPGLLGSDPLELERVRETMDSLLKGHPYAKAPIDIACWDILGQKCRLPLCVLFGGRYGDAFDLYRAISQESTGKMIAKVATYREEGYKKFQLKVGGNPEEDIARIREIRKVLDKGEVLVADANTGWTLHDALRVVAAVGDEDVYIEQPCATYEECRTVREKTIRPFILDEVLDSVPMLVRAISDRAMDVVNIKIAKFGGLTGARQARDLCTSLGIGVTIEDTWGSDIATAAIAHLAHSTPQGMLFSSTDFNSYVTVRTASGGPNRQGGQLAASLKPGLGVEVNPEVFGSPVHVFGL